ncbi:hypothetical protein [Sphingomonas nostoxanthinifaciens]|uniref:hypothetical protein n=1 Tax=Sphingomonas nostoxanthinifaciens TaxID=2872652 RepID=UPI001CC21451|nr:hypothetical protein [Sphingomonas nostoxanthinifaciens]UAK24934.1 hypothetical protein K8P63_01580 [Sphingomonas nostoxanthinifaciens]
MAADPIQTHAARGAAGQRVRVGLTGLAFVFLLVMLATALLHQAGADTAAENAAANAQGPSEPLAELGVAPGNPPQPAPIPHNPVKAAATH